MKKMTAPKPLRSGDRIRGLRHTFIFLDEPNPSVLQDDTVHSPYAGYGPSTFNATCATFEIPLPNYTDPDHQPSAQEGRLNYPDAIDIGPIEYKKGDS